MRFSIVMLVLCLFFVSNVSTGWAEQEVEEAKSIMIDLEFLGERTINTDAYCEKEEYAIGSVVTHWDTMHSDAGVEYIQNQFSCEVPKGVDFASSMIIFSLGREIVELEGNRRPDTHETPGLELTVTFAEGYNYNKAFFYKVKRDAYLPDHMSSECYMRIGTERIFIATNVLALNDYVGEDDDGSWPDDDD